MQKILIQNGPFFTLPFSPFETEIHSPDWPQSHDPLASASGVLGYRLDSPLNGPLLLSLNPLERLNGAVASLLAHFDNDSSNFPKDLLEGCTEPVHSRFSLIARNKTL